jgi:hypothetical protein
MFFSREGGGEECEKTCFFSSLYRGEINTERHNLKQVYLVTATGIKKNPGGLFSRTDGFYIGLFSDRIHI